MASKDLINPVDIKNQSTTRRSADLLPTYHRTDRNTKFLASTLDQFIQQPQITRVDAFVGSKLSLNFNPETDQYLEGKTKLRNSYQLEPSLVISDIDKNIKLALGYDDLIGQLAFYNADTKNLDKLFRAESYSYDPLIDWDKYVNFRNYYWLPTGPDTIEIVGKNKEVTSTYSVTDSEDGLSLIFTPDGLSNNPLLTLYRGQTYVFNVNSQYPFYIKTAYTQGVQNLYENTLGNGGATGQVIVTIDEFTPNILFYYAEGNPTAIGQFAIKSITESTFLDVEKDIIGKKTYTTGKGIPLSNGMKVRFVGNITPSSYADKDFFVEGVGTSITLVDYSTLQTEGDETTNLNTNFDATNFDEYPFDDFRYVPLTPEYVTINRASNDGNKWSKYNRWVHEDVIKAIADYNGVLPNYPVDKRAQRPIVEFNAGLQLYNFGSYGKLNVDLIDTTTTNVFKTVENSFGYYIDGVLIEPGFRVIFNADKDPLVLGRVFEVKYVTVDGVQRVNLEEVTDSDPLLNESILVTKGTEYAGTNWWFNGSQWILGQQKRTLNQAPLFELFDSEGNKFSDQAIYKSSFLGTKVFGYEIGTVFDPVLGFNLAYRNVSNVGEYLFNNFFMTDTFTITDGSDITIRNVSEGFLKLNFNRSSSEFRTVWKKSVDKPIPVIQYQVIQDEVTFVEINAIDNPGFAGDAQYELFVNDIKKIRNVDYTFVNEGPRAFLVSTTGFKNHDRVLIKIFTDKVPNENGYYEVPAILTNNPLNGPISSFTYTEVSDHVKTMVDSYGEFRGSFPGNSNLRDLGNISSYGTRLVSHANPISFAHYFLGTDEYNIVSAVRKAAADYNQFKSNLLRAITDLRGNYSPAQSLDLAMISLNSVKDNTFNYNFSDMIAYGNNCVTRVYTVTDSRNKKYSLTSLFDNTVLSERCVYVYLNNVLLLNNYEYEINKFDPSVTILKDLTRGDVITVLDFNSTVGNFIPPTPTKLGLYPKFKPQIFFDTTYADGPRKVIQGHDGSITLAYNDYRDDVILEFEKRVYNNIKVSYNPELIDINGILPGAFRTGQLSNREITQLISADFLRWAGYYGVDYIQNTTFDELNSFTFNHTGTVDTLEKRPLNGYWRAVYKYFYDTDRPHTHPWEMLGFSEEPSWWQEQYGPAPYTKGNTILWEDLEAGRIAVTPAGSQINPLYARPGLSSIIPVDESGNLISPTDSGLASTPIVNLNDPKRVVMLRNEQIAANWNIGDHSPAETAWRRSSWWPFACQVILALAQPARYAALMFDTSRMKKNLAGEYRYGNNNIFLNPSKVSLFSDVVDDERVLASGYHVWVVEAALNRNLTSLTTLKENLKDVNYQLMAKLGGFASKDKISVGIDATDPTSPYPGVLIPSEDYEIFYNKSTPIESLSISGLIIQKTSRGWSVRGYDRYNPYFVVYKPFKTNVDAVERVGGTSEKFVRWAPNVIYEAGQIVFYNDRYYRVTQKHNSQTTFILAYYQSLPFLPTTGGIAVSRRTQFDKTEVIVPYGVEYLNEQDVYDFILGYGEYLTDKGFVFDEYNETLDQILDWKFTAKEFLYWTTQNWSVNSVITLSPFANKLMFRSDKGIIDSITNNFYEYSLLKADGGLFPKNNFTVVRLDGEFAINTMNTQEGLFFARVNLVQKEHALVMNNFTLFNDVVYSTESGYRQRRVRLKGFLTDNWNGDFFSPGFVFDQAVITDWQKFKDYKIGDVVRFSGNYFSAIKSIAGTATFDITQWAPLSEKPVSQLYPNFDYKINQFEDFYSLDIDNFDVGQQSMAQHLTGYTPRPYLNFIIGDPIAQYKFYQGFIRDKGTKKALTNLTKATLNNFRSAVDFNEEWAFRIGNYGGYNTYSEIETNLDSTKFLENPQIISFVPVKPADSSDLIYYKDESEVIIRPTDFDIENIFKTTDDIENIFKLPVAGYVRFDDITATAYNKNSVLDIANNASLKTGNTIWLGFTDSGDWDVLRVTDIPTYINAVAINVPGQSITLTTFFAHQLSVGELVSVTGVSSEIDQVYIVQQILDNNRFVVLSTLTSLPSLPNPLTGLVYSFKSSRLKTFDNLASVPFLDRWSYNEKVWVDSDGTGKWAVFEKINNYDLDIYGSEAITVNSQHYGARVYADNNLNLILVSAPDYVDTDKKGRVFVLRENTFAELQSFDDFALNDRFNNRFYNDPNGDTGFGQSLKLDYSPGEYYLVIAGAPLTNNIRATYSTSTATFIIDQDSLTFNSDDKQGVVKLSLLNTSTFRISEDLVPVGITMTSPVAGAYYGQSLGLSRPFATTSTVRVDSIANIQIGHVITGTSIQGDPVVTAIGNNNITLNIPQIVNTASPLYFNTRVVASTEFAGTTTLDVSTTTGILVGAKVQGTFISGTPTVQTIGPFKVTLSAPATINTASVVNFVNTQTNGYTVGTRKHLFVGAPFSDSLVEPGKVFVYDLAVSTSSIAVTTGTITELIVPTPIAGSSFGYAITGDRAFNRVAVAAKDYKNGNTSTGAVYIYDFATTSTPVQILTGGDVPKQFVATDFFGPNIKMSDNGLMLVVASPVAYDPDYGRYTGVVDTFMWNGTRFAHSQRISAPISALTTNTVFGYDIDLDETAETLVITAIGNAKTTKPTFDKFTERYPATGETSIASLGLESLYVNDPTSNERKLITTFDGNSTKFSSTIQNAGSVHVYNRLGVGTTKFAYAQPLIDSNIAAGSMYGSSVLVLNNKVIVGAPAKLLNGTDGANNGIGQIFQYNKINTAVNSWALLRNQAPLVDITPIKRAFTVDITDQKINDYVDVIDPIKGNLPGNAAEELRYITPYDPAVYSLGISGVNVNSNSNWLDEHVGELWWDLSTVKYVWYEQGELEYRKNNWNNIFPGSSIDVYEWVRSEYLPSEWANLADTTEGLALGISGQPKFNDNSIISVKQVYNSVSNSFKNVYYFWVKNKSTVPANTKNRTRAAFEVAQLIADPVTAGVKFLSIISPTSLAIANSKANFASDNINLNISFDVGTESANRHTEWLLLQENDANSQPNELLEKKLIDSLLGRDSLGNPVPDPALPSRTRYGIGIRPRQTLFVNRREALRNILEFTNSVIRTELLTGRINFENLNSFDDFPTTDFYDTLVEDIFNLELISTRSFVQGQLEAVIDSNGGISSVNIVNPGFGYVNAPIIEITDNGTGAELKINLNQFGSIESVDILNRGRNYTSDAILYVRPYTVVVQVDSNSANKWAKYEWNVTRSQWIKVQTQEFNTTLFWKYIDWQSESYDPLKIILTTVPSPYALSVLLSLPVGTYVKVQNGGDGRYLILERTDGTQGSFDSNWDIVYSEKGTIQLLDSIWNPAASLFAWDQEVGFDQTQYDQAPDREVEFILKAIREDIFVAERKLYWNQLFFKSVRYAMTEQKFLDWAFKTTFISVINNAGTLSQPATFKLESSRYYEDYLKEIKPYHTKIRKFTEQYTTTELTNTFNTDFDLPIYYDQSLANFNKVEFGDDRLLEYPWKSWFDNYTYEIESIDLFDGGDGYTQVPKVTIVPAPGDSGFGAEAVAFISLGKVSRIVVTNPGQGYVTTPTVVISGGGSTALTPARAYARLGNSPVRSNTIGLRFDRVSSVREVGQQTFTEEFTLTNTVYNLSWLPTKNKEEIVLKRNGILQLIDSFTIDFYEDNYVTQRDAEGNAISEYTKKYATLRLLFVPEPGDIITIEYPKSLDLYNAASRIEDYYEPNAGMPGKELAQLMKGVEYSGLTVLGLPFDAAGGWDAPGIGWAKNSWDNFGIEKGYEAYQTTSTSTQTFSIANLISTGTEVNIYLRTSEDQRISGRRIDSTFVDLTATNTTTFVKTLIGKGTGAVDRIEMIVTGSGYVSEFTSFSISAPNTIGGRTAQAVIDVTSGTNIAGFTITDPGSGYTEPPVITITEAINPNNPTGQVTIQAYARAVLRAEFTEVGSTATTSTVSIPAIAFTTTSSLVIFRYNTSDGTITPTDLDSLDAVISGGSIVNGQSVGALGVNPEEIILDGGSQATRHITGMNDDGFLNPVNSYAPEECVPGQVRESIGITVYTQPAASPPLIANRRYYLNGTDRTYKLGVKPTNRDSVIVLLNSQRLYRIDPISSAVNYTINFAENTVTLTNTATGWLSLTSISSGGIALVDSFALTTESTVTNLISSASESDVGSVYVTVDGIKIEESATPEVGKFVKSDVDGAAQVTVYSSGTIQALFFKGTTNAFSEVNEQIFAPAVAGTKQITLNPAPGLALPFHSQVIVTVNDKRLKPPVTTYYQVEENQTSFDVSKSTPYPLGQIDLRRLEVYVNGTRVLPTRKWSLDQAENQIEFRPGILSTGDVVAIVVKRGHDYLVEGNQLKLVSALSAGDRVRVTTFTNHDPNFIRSERFNGNAGNRYTMQRPVINSAYVWVTYNGDPLTVNLDYSIDSDNRTVVIREGIYTGPSDSIVVTSFATTDPMIAYRIFQDLLGRSHYKRLSQRSGTVLAQDLKASDTIIIVEDAGALTVPDPSKNRPGIILVDGERIEYFTVVGNVLGQLRRSTLGTGLKDIHYAGALVIDQGADQTIPYQDSVQKYTTATTTASNYDLTGFITFDSSNYRANLFEDQVEVRYQGQILLKPGLTPVIHDSDISYDSTSTADSVITPAFTINTVTNVLTLNFDPVDGAKLEVTRKIGRVWYNTNQTLAKNNTLQAKFLAGSPAILPRFATTSTYTPTDLVWRTENNEPILDENNEPYEGI